MNHKKLLCGLFALVALASSLVAAPFVLNPTATTTAVSIPVLIATSNYSIIYPPNAAFGGDISVSNIVMLGVARTRSIINTGAVFIVSSPNASFGDNLIIGGQLTNHVELVISHTALNTNLVFAIYRGDVLKDYQQANGYQLHTGQFEVTGASTFQGALTIGGAFSVYTTNTAPVTPGTVVGWYSITTTNGASFRVPLYQ